MNHDLSQFQKHPMETPVGTIYETHHATTGEPFSFAQLIEAAQLPATTPKNATALFHPSTAPGKQKQDVERHNQMNFACADIDQGDQDRIKIEESLKALGIKALFYSTASAKRTNKRAEPQGHRWRIIAPLTRSVPIQEWLKIQSGFAAVLGGEREALRSTQGYYLPTNPDGGYYEQGLVNGPALDPDKLPALIQKELSRQEQQTQKMSEQAQGATPKPRTTNATEGGIIDLVNSAYGMEPTLEALGYIRKGGNKYLHPNSSSGEAGVILLDGRYYSHHASDPLCDGHTHDVFDVLTQWHHGGDMHAAIRHFAAELDPEGQRQRQRDFKVRMDTETEWDSKKEGGKNMDPYALASSTDELRKLDIKTEYLVENVLPEGMITLFYAPSGMGKSTLATQLSDAVNSGEPFWGLAVKKSEVFYLDYENPLPTISERLKRLGERLPFKIWHHDAETSPPQIRQGGESECLFKIRPRTLLVLDTLKASNNGDENSSTDMKFLFDFLKDLRKRGLTILVLHHTNKGIEGNYRGSSVIQDQSDHVIKLQKIKRGNGDQEGEADSESRSYIFSTGDKTRARPFKMFLTFDECTELFTPTGDPTEQHFQQLKTLIEELTSSVPPNQGALITAAGARYGWSKNKVTSLLKSGSGRHWNEETGLNNAKFYVPTRFDGLPHLHREGKPENRPHPRKHEPSSSRERPRGGGYAGLPGAADGQSGKLPGLDCGEA